jgi:hypothetical protein
MYILIPVKTLISIYEGWNEGIMNQYHVHPPTCHACNGAIEVLA